jgi:hypothetical protein
MGCWNKTCAISQLPIQYGSATVRFFILQAKAYSGVREVETMPSYANGMWELLPVPFYGRYNDYGGQEDDSGQEFKYKFLADLYASKIVGPNPFVDDETINDSIHDDKATIEGRAIASIMIHKHILHAILDVGMKYYRETKYVYSEDMINFLEAYKKFFAELMNDEDKTNPLYLMREMHHDINMAPFLKSDIGKPFKFMPDVAQGLLYHLNGDGSNLTSERVLHRKLLDNIPAKDIVVGYKVRKAFEELRKPIVPQIGEGSQAPIDKMHKAVNDATGDIIRAYFREIRAERNG